QCVFVADRGEVLVEPVAAALGRLDDFVGVLRVGVGENEEMRRVVDGPPGRELFLRALEPALFDALPAVGALFRGQGLPILALFRGGWTGLFRAGPAAAGGSARADVRGLALDEFERLKRGQKDRLKLF